MKIPSSELEAPGVLCKTASGAEYQITYHPTKNRFTLWRLTPDGADKLSTSGDIEKLYAAIPWKTASTI